MSSFEGASVLVTGGSQGAQHLNETIVAAAATIIGAGWQILGLVPHFNLKHI